MSESNGQDQVAQGDVGQDPMSQFFTRDVANEGVKLDLTTPTGARTDHWIKVLGVDSDAYRDAEVRAKREGMQLGSISNEQERVTLMRELQLKTLAAIVVAWSFPSPCTFVNVMAFLKEAPQIADAIDLMISRRALFFAKRSIDSMATQSKSSDST